MSTTVGHEISAMSLQDIWRSDSVILTPQPPSAIGVQSTLRDGHVCSYPARPHRGNVAFAEKKNIHTATHASYLLDTIARDVHEA